MDTDNVAYDLICLDPAIDTMESLKNYVTAFNPDCMAVGVDIFEVVKLVYLLGVEKLAPMEDHRHQRIIAHTNHLIVVNSDAEVIGIFNPPFESSSRALAIKSPLVSG